MMDCCGCGWHLHALRFCSPKGVKIPSQEREVFGLLLVLGAWRQATCWNSQFWRFLKFTQFTPCDQTATWQALLLSLLFWPQVWLCDWHHLTQNSSLNVNHANPSHLGSIRLLLAHAALLLQIWQPATGSQQSPCKHPHILVLVSSIVGAQKWLKDHLKKQLFQRRLNSAFWITGVTLAVSLSCIKRSLAIWTSRSKIINVIQRSQLSQ